VKPWTNLAAITMPPRVARLARDARGYPIPHTVTFDENGTPDFRVIDPAKWAHAARFRCCGLCGEMLGGWLAFVGGDTSMRTRMFIDLPMHRDCAQYALAVCPFLAAPVFAYSRALPAATALNEHVSPDRPDRFGLATTKSYRQVRLPLGDVALLAGELESVEWWRHGRPELTP